MASFQGTQTKWNGSAMQSGCWHTGPTMFASGTIEGNRNGSTISGTVTASNWMPILDRYTQYDFSVTVVVKANGTQIASAISPVGGNWNNIKVPYSIKTNSATSITVAYYCGQTGGCTKPTWPDMKGSLDFPSYNPWSPPDTSGFYGYAQSEGASQDKVVKPDGTIHCWCGGLSGGAGNGTYQSYSMYIDVARGNKLIVDNLSLGDGTDFRFKPWDKYQARPGDLIYVHAVGYTKNEGGGVYQLIDRDVTRYSPITVYKDGAIYLKNGSNKREIVGAYLKDSNGNRVKLSNIKIKDGSNKRSIDLYTTQYE